MATVEPTPGRCNRNTPNGFCEKWPIKGADVCPSHGGSAPQVKAAAARRLIEQKALREVARMTARAGVGLDPIEHLLDSLHQAAQLADVWGLMVATLDEHAEAEAESEGFVRGELLYSEVEDPENPDTLRVVSHDRLVALTAKGEAKIHPFVVEHHAALERRAKFAKLCLDAGVDERRVQIEQDKAKLIAEAFIAFAKEVGLDPADPDVRAGMRHGLSVVRGELAA